MALLFLSVFLGCFAVPFLRRIYRWMVLTKYLTLALIWGCLALAQLGQGWAGYLLSTFMLLGMIGFLGWSMLIAATNMPLLPQLLVRFGDSYNKLKHGI